MRGARQLNWAPHPPHAAPAPILPRQSPPKLPLQPPFLLSCRFVTLLAIAGDKDIQERLLKGTELDGTTYKVRPRPAATVPPSVPGGGGCGACRQKQQGFRGSAVNAELLKP
jgi:hypothetical protein